MRHGLNGFAAGVILLASRNVGAQVPAWGRQFGTPDEERVYAALSDAVGGTFLGGETHGDLAAVNAGPSDAWVGRFNRSGNRLWLAQFGTTSGDAVTALAPDGASGVFVGGATQGSLAAANAGGGDAWIAHFNSQGVRLWDLQFGSSGEESLHALADDGAGGIFACGSTSGELSGSNPNGVNQIWMAHFDGAGQQIWLRQLSANDTDDASSMAADGVGGAWIGGTSLVGPSPGNWDAWFARMDAFGQLGTRTYLSSVGGERLVAMAADDEGGAWIAGFSDGGLGGAAFGLADIWIGHIDASGSAGALRVLGSAQDDFVSACVSDGRGGCYVSGWTLGSLASPLAGTEDGWLARVASTGQLHWVDQIGGAGADFIDAVSSDETGGVFIAGATDSALFGSPLGGLDVWSAHVELPALTSFCTSGTTSHGCLAVIHGIGSPSISTTTPFTIQVDAVEGQRAGLILYGLDNDNFTPFSWGAGTSYLCVKSPLQRTPTQNSGGVFATCTGSLTLDWPAFVAAHPGALGQPFALGQRCFAQGWFRDATSSKSTNLSDALEFVLQP